MAREKLPVRIYETDKKASIAVARRIAKIIHDKAAAGGTAVLGLATGHTPIDVYRELIRMHREEGLDFTNVQTFNLDEYWPIQHDAPQSYHRWMKENLFDHVNIPAENIHIPSGTVEEDGVEAYCRDYEQKIEAAGGIDFQILGIGRSGHIGFNEPGSDADSRTRRVELDRITRTDATGDFFGEQHVPNYAITMGVGTILDAREIVLMAFGEHKAPIIKRAVEGPQTNEVAASFLQNHQRAMVHVSTAAAEHLTRIATPWLVEEHCDWDELLERRAVLWLSQQTGKAILKLTDEDYAEHGLGELIRIKGGAYNVNLATFKRMMNTITGWPGGKRQKKRILILSPHPDDDVICMAGTMTRLAEHGHDVHVAYMVSGSLAVFDHDVIRLAELLNDFNRIFSLAPEASHEVEEKVVKFLREKAPNEIDSLEVRKIKDLIRRSEAAAASKDCGLVDRQIHFLDLPFYHSGTVQKLPVSDADVKICRRLFDDVAPEMIFAAGDMSDPHGTHRQCLEAALAALETYMTDGRGEPELWYYRGAWQEWSTEQIDMAVPLSPDEMKAKRFAIFRHESQKDKAMFPGPYDEREFWQRAEERNKETAATYDALGLPEYHAVEAFVRSPVTQPAQVIRQFTAVDEP